MKGIFEEIADWDEAKKGKKPTWMSTVDEIREELDRMSEAMQKEAEIMKKMELQLGMLREFVREFEQTNKEREMERKRKVERLEVALDDELILLGCGPAYGDRKRG